MAAPRACKIQIFGHSFVKRLREFIRQSASIHFHMNLQGPPLVQYSGFPGASIKTLRDNLDVVADFGPDILVLVVGTIDIYNDRETPQTVAQGVCDLVDTLLFVTEVPKVIVLQTLHRVAPSIPTRYPVDDVKFNSKVDELNMLLIDRLNHTDHHRSYLWRMKGFWSPTCKHSNFAADGCHLSDAGQLRLISNVRAAIVAALRESICRC